MKANDTILNEKYKSKVNDIAKGCLYEVVKKNKVTCHVKLWENGKPTNVVYKNVPYRILTS